MTLTEAAAVMAEHGWLSRRPAEFRDAVVSRCRIRHYEAQEAVYREGDASSSIMGLVSGRWFVRVPPADIAITIGLPGFWIGEAGFFRGADRAASVISATPSVGLYLAPAAFEELITRADYCRHFAANTAETLAEAIAVIGNLSQPRSDIRVAQRLVTMAVFNDQPGDITLPLSQADLAELCNLSRSTTIAILQQLADAGLISLGYRRILINDLTALTDFAWNSDRLFR
jgi:CRP-like cAMP-binding protein